jgi:RimJ/RimL family protein N-acetyltransferase
VREIELQPVLVGEKTRLRPVREDDFEALYRAASDPKVWQQHPDSQRFKRDVFEKRFFRGAIESETALIIQERHSKRVIGSSRYYDWNPENKEIAIGYTFIERGHWGLGTNSEVKQLMLNHISQWVDRVWFHIGKDNIRSRKAVEKLGAKFCHEEPKEVNGISFVQVFYKLKVASS